jgi:hypothetical protein
MNDDDYTRVIGKAIDSAFEDLAEELDQIAGRHDLTSVDMRELLALAGTDFIHYYSDWMQESWERLPEAGNS